MALDATRFRAIMGCLVAGVTVVTTLDRQGTPRGLTATAVCSVSLTPPLVLVCIDQAADCYEAFREARAFALNLLREDQERLSRQFATKDALKFEGIAHRPGVTGVPILSGTLAHLECLLTAQYPGGDHTILVDRLMPLAQAHAPARPDARPRSSRRRLQAWQSRSR